MSKSGKSVHVSEKILVKRKYLKLVELTYKGRSGKEMKWESVERTTRTKIGIDGVDIIAVLKKKGKKDQLVLIKQYRAPMKTTCIEFPAGLVDEKETCEFTALKELREETGYVGKFQKESVLLGMEVGMTNANCKIVVLEIDGDAKENIKPEQELEPTEDIEVLLIDIDTSLKSLHKFAKEGNVVDAKLWTFCYGMSFGYERGSIEKKLDKTCKK